MSAPAPALPLTEIIRVRVGFSLTFDVPFPTPMLFVVEPQERPGQRLLESRRLIEPGAGVTHLHRYFDAHGNVIWRMLAQPGTLTISHDVMAEVSGRPDPQFPDLPKTLVEDLPDDTLRFLLPSRYADSDLLAAEAWERFGHIQGGWAQVQAISDHLYGSCMYGVGSNSTTTAQQAYASGKAVCRDFAHMGVAFCRALNIPARYACGYLGDIGIPPDGVPMDFHAWFEAYLGGQWRTFDARHNKPRIGRILIATGRDAADVAFTTTFGAARLTQMTVWADQVPLDAELPEDGRPHDYWE
ncbi:transglutaminase family protein [Deinococcus detaillensis]|uniref:Transglutaminase family protein n=1 Tax=Deinococcus detaillensis TaxID=2592048 RepID=A0A553V3T8_9DEIO|nr:transglutaminase family protein [Deinococcus detaillensis]TSA87160.1 transglutaminase family protein [Deinococcus detaillensis]